ncbi:hypothetical protein GE543_15985 [Pseudomonas sp. SZ57]|nr:hypothetical protein [Pseudomonas sp. SZ57]
MCWNAAWWSGRVREPAALSSLSGSVRNDDPVTIVRRSASHAVLDAPRPLLIMWRGAEREGR